MSTERGNIDTGVIADMMNRYDAKMSTRLKGIFDSLVKPELPSDYNTWRVSEVIKSIIDTNVIYASFLSVKSLSRNRRLSIGFQFTDDVTDDTLGIILTKGIERIAALIKDYIDKGEPLPES
jgi:hypothetical protein